MPLQNSYHHGTPFHYLFKNSNIMTVKQLQMNRSAPGLSTTKFNFPALSPEKMLTDGFSLEKMYIKMKNFRLPNTGEILKKEKKYWEAAVLWF